uniref:Uncharacterized protein n=2 Tax=Oryza sativa subsp. japonica TaxID=39947 RepID=Q9AUP2_ORYSJ|nr:Putative protein retrotransposable elements TNP2 protein [Oryza sativa Japonica Group]
MKLTMKLSVAFAFFFFLAATTTAFAQCTFEILVKTDGRWYAGTNARVSLQRADADDHQLGVLGPDGCQPRLLRKGEPRPVQGHRRLHAVGALQHGAHLRRVREHARLVRELRNGDAARAGEPPVDDAPVGGGSVVGHRRATAHAHCRAEGLRHWRGGAMIIEELKVLMLIIASKKCYVMQRTLVTKEKIMRDLPGWLQIRRLLCTYCKPKYTRLSAVLELMKLKTSNGWTDTSFTKLLDMLSDMLPEGNMLAKSTYEAKKYHPYRNMMEAFNGQREIGVKPRHFTGRQVHDMVKDISNVFGLEPVVKDGPYAVDMLEQATPCILKVEVIPSFAVEAAKWKAYPPLNTETIHHAQHSLGSVLPCVGLHHGGGGGAATVWCPPVAGARSLAAGYQEKTCMNGEDGSMVGATTPNCRVRSSSCQVLACCSQSLELELGLPAKKWQPLDAGADRLTPWMKKIEQDVVCLESQE